MSEFIEIGFWLFVFLALALRNVANRAKQASESGERTAVPASAHDRDVERTRERDVAARAAQPAAAPTRSEGRVGDAVRWGERQRVPSRRDVSQRRERETARRRERETKQRRGREAALRREREGGRRGGRRSILGNWAELAREIERKMQEAEPEGGAPIDPAGPTVDRTRREPAPRPRLGTRTRALSPTRADAHDPARVRRPGPAVGLDRLERYDPLKRAVLLAEILGPPPGLSDEGPRLGRWDPSL